MAHKNASEFNHHELTLSLVLPGAGNATTSSATGSTSNNTGTTSTGASSSSGSSGTGTSATRYGGGCNGKVPNVMTQAESRELATQLKEAIEANKQWAKYNETRDELINRLLTKVKDLELRATTSLGASPCPGSTPERLTITQWQAHAMQETTLRLHLENVNQHQQAFIQELQHMLHERPELRTEDSERITLLQNQVQVFSEDFYQERRDRERAQERISELEEEVQLLNQQLEQFQDSHMSYLATRRYNTMEAYHDEYARQVALGQHQQHRSHSPSHYGQSRLIAHGRVECDMPSPEEDEDEDTVDLPVNRPFRTDPASYDAADTKTNEPVRTKKQLNLLECPKCGKHFFATDPLGFLEHNDLCSK